MRRFLTRACLGCLVAALCLVSVAAQSQKTKTASGKVRSIRGNVLTLQKPSLLSVSMVDFEMTDATKKVGQLAPGMHAKIKYREEGHRKIALEIYLQPEYASKTAKKAASQTQP